MKILSLFLLCIFALSMTNSQDPSSYLQQVSDDLVHSQNFFGDKSILTQDRIKNVPIANTLFKGLQYKMKSEIHFPNSITKTTNVLTIIGSHPDEVSDPDLIQNAPQKNGDFAAGPLVAKEDLTRSLAEESISLTDNTDELEFSASSEEGSTLNDSDGTNVILKTQGISSSENYAAETDGSSSDSGALWIEKNADSTVYDFEQNITYTIKYGNKGADAIDVSITDILPNIELNGTDPAATSQIGNNLTWQIGTLKSGQSGLITIWGWIPAPQNMDYGETSSVYGIGFVNLRKSLSTFEENNSIKNIAQIKDRTRSISASVSVKLYPGGIIKNAQHGSGYYKGVHISSLNKNKKSLNLNEEIFAEHKLVAVDLPKNRTLTYNSKWSDRTSAKIPEEEEENHENYQYMDKINKESKFSLAKSESVFSSQGNFSGGIAEMGYTKDRLNGAKSSNYISETYQGNFTTEQSLDSYGETPAYSKYAKGTGFVSSDKKMASNLRSYEHGSGSYESAEVLRANTIHKNSSLIYLPTEQSIGMQKTNHTDKWYEGMVTINPDTGSEISNRISSAESIQKEALMSKSFLSMTGSFIGQDLLEIGHQKSRYSKIEYEQVFSGDFRMDTTIGISESMKYLYPHINITKRVFSRNDHTIIYRINVTNDGNKTLEPVIVVDLLPEGATFLGSTLKPVVQGRLVSWSLLALPAGEKQTIDLKAWLEDVSPSTINKVKAIATYQNRTLTASSESSPYKIYETLEEKEEKENETTQISSNGEWKPPSCMAIGTNQSICDCEKDIDDYYNSLDDCQSDCP
jgi:uncharacterized repeat protein (TIGR01451 family)